MPKIIVTVDDNYVRKFCMFMELIEGVTEYERAAEEHGVSALQTTNTGMHAIALIEEMVSWMCNHSMPLLSPELQVWEAKADLFLRAQHIIPETLQSMLR